MYKATRQDVKQLQKWGKDNEVIQKLMAKEMVQPSIYRTAYYSAPSWNWAYEIGLATIDGVVYELLTQFGSIKGGREIYMPTYRLKELMRGE